MGIGPYVVTPDVDEYGFLYGGEDLFPADPVNHRWLHAYPTIKGALELSWERGSSGIKPSIFSHNLLRDYICNQQALRVLQNLTTHDINIIGNALLDGEELSIVQVVAVLDVVDESRSIPSQYSWAKISFPYISLENGKTVRRRMFRIPNPELSLMVLAGEEVKEECEKTGLIGWSFEPVIGGE